jgi:hypothetical protein
VIFVDNESVFPAIIECTASCETATAGETEEAAGSELGGGLGSGPVAEASAWSQSPDML